MGEGMYYPVFFLFVVLWTPLDATVYRVESDYKNGSAVPYLTLSTQDGGCDSYGYGARTGGWTSTNCSENYLQTMRDMFGSSKYIIQEVYSGEECSTFEFAIGFQVTNTCAGIYGDDFHFISSLSVNGSASIEYFVWTDSEARIEDDGLCLPTNLTRATVDKDQLQAHTCLAIGSPSDNSTQVKIYSDLSQDNIEVNSYRWYSSNDRDEDSALSTGTIVAIVCGCVAAIFFIVVLSVCYRRRNQWNPKQQWTSTEGLDDADSLEAATRYNRGLWNDEIIIAKKLPRDKVKIQKLISRGAFGEVYAGQLHRNQVAVKMLLPATRNSLKHVDDFLAEAKMTAVMDHPHVVSFIGVAWDSLSDVCVVLEFMDGGDLRTLLNKYETSKHPVGFDKQKATIALHVCHALTYLHSLAPPVIHRDLKSRNILLNKAMHAKLTDFGISRERLDQTMTAGMGTSLWMAPEVMLGERYDVKADMFSFGVVLSELDVHTLPYAQEKKRSLDSGGRALADATLLQRVAEGTVRVEFSEGNASFITELGCACVSVDPSQRPSAAEALYKLQLVLTQGLQQLTL